VTHTPNEPVYATPGSGAADVHAFCPESAISVYPGEVVAVPTGLKFEIPVGTGLHILPRSGLGKRKIMIANSPGLLDSDYQGELFILVYNTSEDLFTVHDGDRIAQLELVKLERMAFVTVDSFDTVTVRGEGGFGSTGGITHAS
jgi:dUTP pyrophosphatase